MKNLTLSLATTFILGSLSLTAQDPKHVNYYKAPAAIETEQYSLSFDDLVAKMEDSKFAFKLKNLTTDYLIIDKGASAFVIDGKEYKDKDKEIILPPNKTRNGVFRVSGETNYHVDKYTFKFDGVSLLPADGKVHEASNFKLPASTNEITFGDFTVKLKNLKKETKETIATFEVTYKGDEFGIVDGSKLAVTVPDKGTSEFANDAKGQDGQLLRKGKSCTVKAVFHIPAKYSDMQFANMEILWRNTFQSSSPTPLEGGSVDVELDPGLTAGKNK